MYNHRYNTVWTWSSVSRRVHIQYLSCRCLVARARCSSSMMQLGGSWGCMAPRWGEPVGVSILPRNASLGRVKFRGRVAGAGLMWFTWEPVKDRERPIMQMKWKSSWVSMWIFSNAIEISKWVKFKVMHRIRITDDTIDNAQNTITNSLSSSKISHTIQTSQSS